MVSTAARAGATGSPLQPSCGEGDALRGKDNCCCGAPFCSVSLPLLGRALFAVGPGAAAEHGDAAAPVAGGTVPAFFCTGGNYALSQDGRVWQTHRRESQKGLVILAGAMFVTSLFQQALRTPPTGNEAFENLS